MRNRFMEQKDHNSAAQIKKMKTPKNLLAKEIFNKLCLKIHRKVQPLHPS